MPLSCMRCIVLWLLISSSNRLADIFLWTPWDGGARTDFLLTDTVFSREIVGCMATSPFVSLSVVVLCGTGVSTFPFFIPTRRVRTGRGRTGGGSESTLSNCMHSLNQKILGNQLKRTARATLHTYQRIIQVKLTICYKYPCLLYHSAVFFIPISNPTLGTKLNSAFA